MAASVASHSRPHEVPRPGARRPRPFRDHADLIARREPFSRLGACPFPLLPLLPVVVHTHPAHSVLFLNSMSQSCRISQCSRTGCRSFCEPSSSVDRACSTRVLVCVLMEVFVSVFMCLPLCGARMLVMFQSLVSLISTQRHATQRDMLVSF